MSKASSILLNKKRTKTKTYVRRMRLQDLENVQNLITPIVTDFFGDVNIHDLWEMSYLSLVYCSYEETAEYFNKRASTIGCNQLTQNEIEENISGSIFVTNYPPIKSIAPWTWDSWLYKLYRLETITIQNTLWVHFMAWNEDHLLTFFPAIIEFLYAYCPWLHYVLFVKPPGLPKFINVNILEKYCTAVLPKDYATNKRVQTLFLTSRWHFLKTYKIRRAVEEDNDDVVPLIDMHSRLPRDMYGDYYVAELVYKFPDCGRQLIVAEYNGLAVAVLCFNSALDYKVLNDNYELRPFYGLRKPDSRDRVQNIEDSSSGDSQSFGFQFKSIKYSQSDNLNIDSLTSMPSVIFTPINLETKHSIYAICNEDMSEEEEDDIILATSNFDLTLSSMESLLPYDVEAESTESTITVRPITDQYSSLMLNYNETEMIMLLNRYKFKGRSYEELEFCCKSIKPFIQFVPLYMGKENGFSLEIAASEPEHEDAALNELLIAAFECFPDRDYCVLTIPSTARSFQFLEEFIHVVPRPVSSFSQEVYVLHRNAVAAQLIFREALPKDIEQVRMLTSEIGFPDPILTHLEAIFTEEDLEARAFVLASTTTIIGVAVIREERDADYIREHYELLPWLQESMHSIGSYGLIEHLLISPIFQRYGRFFLRELHRLTDFSVLYYRLFPNDAISNKRQRCLIGVLSELPSPRPRRIPEYNTTDLDDRIPVEAATRVESPFALFLSTIRLCGIKPIIINHRIVVVGASDCALSFLETLVCNTNCNDQLIFNNVTIISPHGMGYVKQQSRNLNSLFVYRGKWCHQYLQLISLRTYVNLVNGIMTAIDRQNKLLTINDDTVLPYDILVLTCGEQYQKPGPQIITSPKKMRPATDFPANFFLINTDVDGVTALTKTKTLISKAKLQKLNYQIIVYGCTLDTYCCLSALLQWGIPGANIAFVEPFPEKDTSFAVSCFNDAEIDEAVQEAIKKEGISVYSSYYYSEYTLHPAEETDEPTAKSVKFVSKHRYLELDCLAMFYYGLKGVSIRTYLAITKAGLVYDGRLVIDSKFMTNDPNIYAAGTLTKYKRKYYADHLMHKYFNMDEIGRELAMQLREKLKARGDQIKTDNKSEPVSNDRVPHFTQPLIYHCKLPGNWNYLYVTKPGVQIPVEAASTTDDYGEVLITGSVRSKTQGYFRIHLNCYKTVQTITCVNKEALDINNIISLWGKHEQVLNNLLLRFEMVMITDLFEYFRQPWTCAIFHDRFPRLEIQANDITTAPSEMYGDSPLEEFYAIFTENNWKQLTPEQRKQVEEKFEASPYQTKIEELVLDFIQDNISQLPMYAHPLVVKSILQGYENSPLFNPY